MTNSTFEYPCGISGLNQLSVEYYADSANDASAAAVLDLVEDTNRHGYYRVVTSLSGIFWCRVLNGDGIFDQGFVNFVGGKCKFLREFTTITVTDPLSEVVPGTYSAGSAGNVLGNLATTLSLALSQSVQVSGYKPNRGEAVDLVYGDDYYAADNNPVSFIISGAFASWTSATIALVMTVNGITQSVPATAFTATGSSRPVSFDIPKAISIALGIGTGTYDVVVTLATSAHINTVVKSGCFSIST